MEGDPLIIVGRHKTQERYMSELFTKNNQSEERNREICAYVFGLQTQRNFGTSFDQVRMQLEIIFLFIM